MPSYLPNVVMNLPLEVFYELCFLKCIGMQVAMVSISETLEDVISSKLEDL